jgi:hypothetical protein
VVKNDGRIDERAHLAQTSEQRIPVSDGIGENQMSKKGSPAPGHEPL